jgi:chromosome segregation ATPase
MSDIRQIKMKIEELEKKLQAEERNQSVLEGKLETLKEQLKKEFQCNDVEAARKLLQKLQDEKKKLEEERAAVIKELDQLLEK